MPMLEDTLRRLDELNAAYALDRHPAVYTIEEVDALDLPRKECICKNLFLRNAKGDTHYLAVLPGHKKADLQALREQLGSTKLSFASQERLMAQLKLTKGSVSPLGVLNNDGSVVVVLDRALRELPVLGVHPNDNTGTVWMSLEELCRIIGACGSPVVWVDLPADN